LYLVIISFVRFRSSSAKFNSFNLIPNPRTTLFPFTTLFRSARVRRHPRLPRAVPVPAGRALPGRDRARDPHLGHRDRVARVPQRSEEHTSELQSRENLVCRLLLEKKK